MDKQPNRRQFVKTLASYGAASSVAPAFAAGTTAANTTKKDEWGRAFDQALAKKPWLLGYQTASADAFEAPAKLTGKWPAQLQGRLFRNGPARHEIGDFRYRHWFDGDGMVQSWQLSPNHVEHQGKLVQTRKLTEEQAAGRALYPGFGSVPPNPAAVTSPDLVNVANISVLPHHGKLFALWEAGSPWEIDADTLETKGMHSFSSDTQGVPFSAHPRVEPDGTLWNFGYLSNANLVVLWHINAKGRVVKTGTIKVDPMTMPHDFVVTEKHLVILLPPLHYVPGGASSFMQAHRWAGEDPTRVMVVDKNDFSNVQWFELDAQWVFHFGNAWEDKHGVVRFDAAHTANPETMLTAFRDIMRGATPQGTPSYHHQYRIDTVAGKATQAPLMPMGIESEFPAIDPRVSTQQYRYLTMLSSDQAQPAPHQSFTSVSRLDLKSEALQTYSYPPQKIPEEHLYIADQSKGPEQGGWILGTALDYATAQTELNVFDAEHLADGPLATATLPYALPLGLHGKFVADKT